MNHPYLSRLGAALTLTACLAALAATSGTLPAPPTQGAQLPRWWSAADPTLAVGGLLRVLATALCAYLLAVTVLDLLAITLRWRPLSRLTRRLAPAAWRHLVLPPVMAGAVALPSAVVPTTTASAMAQVSSPDTVDDTTRSRDSAPDVVITMTWRGAASSTPTTIPPSPDDGAVANDDAGNDDGAVAGDRALNDDGGVAGEGAVPGGGGVADDGAAPAEDPRAGDNGTSAPSTAPATAGTSHDHSHPTDAEATPHAAGRHRVTRGDSLWSIAASRVAEELAREPTAREVHRYWRDLIAANRDRLPVPGNPDLIFPGDEVVLPERR